MANGIIQNPHNLWENIYIGDIASGKTLTFSGNASLLLVLNGTTTSRQGMYIVFGRTSGSPFVTTVVAASSATVVGSTGKLDISGDCYATIIPLTDAAAGRISIT